ncbi:uncharacterized protein B0H18DRAFT_226057 [Fomitopsis serialis]|uniref:uncharacterized protein n=1 Tax=Fomitopsis serialis TaxID=139415 RepID=UPI00200816A2|nr:uncharacterized protein B0H18DRAFT_226057 [Neoantrodia serialis]KAH9912892.1 hypothetical protein B0H18DRAFT_226057 [Neoantrodia serialis]
MALDVAVQAAKALLLWPATTAGYRRRCPVATTDNVRGLATDGWGSPSTGAPCAGGSLSREAWGSYDCACSWRMGLETGMSKTSPN